MIRKVVFVKTSRALPRISTEKNVLLKGEKVAANLSVQTVKVDSKHCLVCIKLVGKLVFYVKKTLTRCVCVGGGRMKWWNNGGWYLLNRTTEHLWTTRTKPNVKFQNMCQKHFWGLLSQTFNVFAFFNSMCFTFRHSPDWLCPPQVFQKEFHRHLAAEQLWWSELSLVYTKSSALPPSCAIFVTRDNVEVIWGVSFGQKQCFAATFWHFFKGIITPFQAVSNAHIFRLSFQCGQFLSEKHSNILQQAPSSVSSHGSNLRMFPKPLLHPAEPRRWRLKGQPSILSSLVSVDSS